MSEPLNTGGPAFPTLMKSGVLAIAEGGMSLRDYFAAKAMPVLLAADLARPIDRQRGPVWVAEQSYKIADAMMDAREAS